LKSSPARQINSVNSKSKLSQVEEKIRKEKTLYDLADLAG